MASRNAGHFTGGLGLLSDNKPFLAACASVHVAPLVSLIAQGISLRRKTTMASASTLKAGDFVEYGGKRCEVIAVSKGSEVIGIKCHDPHGFMAYVYAWKCRKAS